MKPKVLVFVDWFLPGYKAGGPIKSVANIVHSLKEEIDFSIVTSNVDFGENETYTDIKPNVWIQQDGFRTIYLSATNQKLQVFRKLLKEENPEIVYFNSLFSVPYTLLPLLANKIISGQAKIVLAPRGMLGQGALQLKKRKKQLFLTIAKVLGLFNKVTWHASTAMEAAEIKVAFGNNATIKIATNIASLAASDRSFNVKSPQNTAFFFLSRISPKKNLLGALSLLSNLSLPNKVSFDIIGPVEDEKYWQQCQAAIAKLPPSIKVEYKGAIPNPQLPAVLQNYHFLLLPTFSENYGHVVVEAWASGCSVILSDQTPWRNLEEVGIGWDIPLADEERYIDVLQQCVLMNDNEFQHMCKNTQTFMTMRVVTEEIIEQNRRLFKAC